MNLISPQWKYKINIKDQFNEGDESPEHIGKLCASLIRQIGELIPQIEKSNLDDDEIYRQISDLEEVKGNLEWLRDLCTGKIPEKDWGDYEFDGNFVELFDDYLNDLYNIGDCKVVRKDGKIEKFIWIG